MALTKIPSELSSTTGIVDNSNATAITIDSNENVGIGTSSITNNTLGKTTYFGNSTSSITGDSSNARFWLGNNWYFNSGDKFIGTGYSNLYTQQDGNHEFLTSTASGTAGSAASYNSVLKVDASGRVTTPSQPAFSVGGDGSGWNALTGASTHSVIDTWHSNVHFQRGGSNFNPSTGKFTAPVTGYYMFIFSSYTRVPNPSTTNYIYPRFLINGYNYGFYGHILHYQNHGDADLGSQISVIIPLATNDWVSATFYVNGQGDFHANSQRFEGYLIG